MRKTFVTLFEIILFFLLIPFIVFYMFMLKISGTAEEMSYEEACNATGDLEDEQ